MNWMTSLEKRFGSWAIPNLTAYLIVLQVIGIAQREIYKHGGKGYLAMPSGHIHFQTPWGDGEYPVYVKKNQDGQVIEIKIDLDPDVDEDDDYEEEED